MSVRLRKQMDPVLFDGLNDTWNVQSGTLVWWMFFIKTHPEVYTFGEFSSHKQLYKT